MKNLPAVDPVVTMSPFFFRRRDTAALLGVSESLVLEYERRGWLHVVKLPGVRAVRHTREGVEELARQIRAGELGQ